MQWRLNPALLAGLAGQGRFVPGARHDPPSAVPIDLVGRVPEIQIGGPCEASRSIQAAVRSGPRIPRSGFRLVASAIETLAAHRTLRECFRAFAGGLRSRDAGSHAGLARDNAETPAVTGRVRPARHSRGLGGGRELPALCGHARAKRGQAVFASDRRRQGVWKIVRRARRVAVLQSARARQRRGPRGRLAGAVGGVLCPGSRPRPAGDGRAAVHASRAASGRGDSHAVHHAALLAGRRRGAGAEPRTGGQPQPTRSP